VYYNNITKNHSAKCLSFSFFQAVSSDLKMEVNEAEDLSTKSKTQQSNPPSPPPTPPSHHHSYPSTVKLEYATSLPNVVKHGGNNFDHMSGRKSDTNYGERQHVAHLFMGQSSYHIYPPSENRHFPADSPPPPPPPTYVANRTICQPSSSWSTHSSLTSSGGGGIINNNERDK